MTVCFGCDKKNATVFWTFQRNSYVVQFAAHCDKCYLTRQSDGQHTNPVVYENEDEWYTAFDEFRALESVMET